MKRVGPRLKDQGHRPSRGQPVIGAVVGSQSTKLSDRVRRGSNAHAASATAVIIFAAVEQINVVVLTHAVKFHAGVSTDRCVGGGGIDLTRRSRCQSSKLVDAASVYCKLCQLLTGDEVAHLAGVRLHADGIRFDSDRFLRRAQGHLEIHTSTVTDVQHQPLLLGNFEARSFGLDIVVANLQVDRHILPRFVCGKRVRQVGLRVSNCDFHIGDH